MNLKEEIERLITQITEDQIATSTAITKAKTLNSQIQNEKLRLFIDGEFYEKYNDDTLPTYRLIWGEPTFEFVNNFTGATDIRSIPLPEGFHFNGKSTNYRPILSSIDEIENAVKTNKGNTFKFLFTPGQLEIAERYVLSLVDNAQNWQLKRAWWSHSLTSLPTILFKAKQFLLDILLEIDNSTLEKDFKEKIYSESSQFDASFEFLKFIEEANSTIILIDGYVDGTTLKLLSSKKSNVIVQILTDPRANSNVLDVLVEKFNKQYGGLEIRTSNSFHDRFLIIDQSNFYQFGTSVKDLGNKTFSVIKLTEKFMTNVLQEKFNLEWKK